MAFPYDDNYGDDQQGRNASSVFTPYFKQDPADIFRAYQPPVASTLESPDITGQPTVPGPGIAGPGSPRSPLSAMLGNYQQKEQEYSDLMRQGPGQFHPSIWRRLAGVALGTAAGLPSHRGLGRYGYESGDPREAFNVAQSFTFGPQARMNKDFERRTGAAKSEVDASSREYEMMRQENQDDLAQRRLDIQQRQNKLTQIPGPDGKLYPAFVDAEGNVTPFFFPEQVGQKPLPEALAGQFEGGRPDPNQTALAKLKQQEDQFYSSDEFKRWKTLQDNATKERIAAMRNQATQNKAPAAILQAATYSKGGLDRMASAEQAMQQLEASGVMGQSWFQNKFEDILFGKGAVDPSVDPQTRQAIGALRAALGYTSTAAMRAHTGRTSQEIYNDFKSRLGVGQDWMALRGAMKETRSLLTDYVMAASDQSIANLRSGNAVPPQPPANSNEPPGPAGQGMKWQRSNRGNWRQVPVTPNNAPATGQPQ